MKRKVDAVDIIMVVVMFSFVLAAFAVFLTSNDHGGVTSGTLIDYANYEDKPAIIRVRLGSVGKGTKFCVDGDIKNEARQMVGEQVVIEYRVGSCRFGVDYTVTAIRLVD